MRLFVCATRSSATATQAMIPRRFYTTTAKAIYDKKDVQELISGKTEKVNF